MFLTPPSASSSPSLLQFDREHFSEVFVDLKWFESKVGNKYLNEAAGLAAEKEAASKAGDKEVCAPAGLPETRPLTRAAREPLCSHLCVEEPARCLTAAEKPGDEEEEEDLFETEFRQYKRTYYMTKMGVDVVSE